MQEKNMTRRKFLGLMAGVSSAAALTGCSAVEDNAGTGWLPTQYSREADAGFLKGRIPIAHDDPSIERDDEKCILCGQCIEACEKVQSVYGFYELPVIDEVICIHCGQCTLWCPTGAITEKIEIAKALEWIDDPDIFTVIAPSPATRVDIAEEFGLDPGTWVEGQLVSSFRKAGFDRALDINFGADLTIMEEASELVDRVTNKGVLPMFTSCCPGWMKFVEYNYPDLIPHISTARSPISMQGPITKTYYLEKLQKEGVTTKSGKPVTVDNMRVITVAPCVDKKFEIARPEFEAVATYHKRPTGEMRTIQDNDLILSIREYANLLRLKGIDLSTLPKEKFDPLMSEDSGGAVIFANTGGVMEAAARSAYYFATNKQPPDLLLNLQPVRGLDGIRRASFEIPGVGEVKVVVAHGLNNARKMCDELREIKARGGALPFHFMEVMACPGGCIGGGGTPKTSVPPQDWVRVKRINCLYDKDKAMKLRNSHDNPEIIKLYDTFLGKPLGHLAHELLHTHNYSRAEHITPLKKEDYPFQVGPLEKIR